MTPEEMRVRRDAKAANERLKLVAALLNNAILALLTTAILGPIISHKLDQVRSDYILLAIAFQLAAHGILLYWYRSED